MIAVAVAVRWYLRDGLSYRDADELLSERGIERILAGHDVELRKSCRPAPPGCRIAGNGWDTPADLGSGPNGWLAQLRACVGTLLNACGRIGAR